ncbi:hypothetical protein [Staphylococcus saprophyticus]|uniref:hypothetical protein n=1 Tax=Staphylococcus saprophyticus TaxID=29385 RepID=UPI0011A58C39|nr:hypothetical protein [Staphylococcus saprophyticus]
MGYGKGSEEELEFYMDIGEKEGIIVDGRYSGKGFRGLVDEIKCGGYDNEEKIVFIDRGGVEGYSEERGLGLERMLDKIDV